MSGSKLKRLWAFPKQSTTNWILLAWLRIKAFQFNLLSNANLKFQSQVYPETTKASLHSFWICLIFLGFPFVISTPFHAQFPERTNNIKWLVLQPRILDLYVDGKKETFTFLSTENSFMEFYFLRQVRIYTRATPTSQHLHYVNQKQFQPNEIKYNSVFRIILVSPQTTQGDKERILSAWRCQGNAVLHCFMTTQD